MQTIIFSALATAFILVAGAIVGGALGAILNERLPGHPTDLVNIFLSALPALGGVVAGGAVWGWALSRITRAGNRRRMAWAGAIGFGPTVIVAALALPFFRDLIVEQQQGPQLPIHNVFTMVFVPAAAIVAGVGGMALGIGVQNRAMARKLLWMCALAGGISFLVVNLTMDTLGWRVGAPGAEARATMLTTALLGNSAAALVGGGIIGKILGGEQRIA